MEPDASLVIPCPYIYQDEQLMHTSSLPPYDSISLRTSERAAAAIALIFAKRAARGSMFVTEKTLEMPAVVVRDSANAI